MKGLIIISVPFSRTKLRGRVKVEVAVLGSLSLMVPMTSVDVKQHWTRISLPEVRSCVKVEVAVLGSLSLIVLNGFRGRNAIALCANRCLLGYNTAVLLGAM